MPSLSPSAVWNIYFYFYAFILFGQMLLMTPVFHFLVMKPMDRQLRPEWKPLGYPGEALWKANGYILLVTSCWLLNTRAPGFIKTWAKHKRDYENVVLGIDHDIRESMTRLQRNLCYWSAINYSIILIGLPLYLLHDFVLFPGFAGH